MRDHVDKMAELERRYVAGDQRALADALFIAFVFGAGEGSAALGAHGISSGVRAGVRLARRQLG